MRPVSAAFLRTVTSSHRMLARATVCAQFQTTTTPTGTRIPILGGDVQIDGTAGIRSTLDLLTDGTGMWPQRSADQLAPYGNEIYVERGIQYSDDLVEWVGLGYFRIDEPGQDVPPDGPIRVTGSDRMAGLIDARLIAPRQYLAGASLGSVVSDLVTEVYPDAVIEWDDNTDAAVLVRPMTAEEDRHAFIDDLVTSQAKIWLWDHRGALVIKSVPNPATPVVEVGAGEDGVLLSMNRSLSRKGVYSAVVATGEGADETVSVRAVVVDNNPRSPTYYFGRFGPVPRFFSSPFLTTHAQAVAAATAILRQCIGLPYQVDFSAVPNPALEPFDPVLVRYSDAHSPETHILQSLSVPLLEDVAMTATTREQNVVLIGSV